MSPPEAVASSGQHLYENKAYYITVLAFAIDTGLILTRLALNLAVERATEKKQLEMMPSQSEPRIGSLFCSNSYFRSVLVTDNLCKLSMLADTSFNDIQFQVGETTSYFEIARRRRTLRLKYPA
jgi:hypothetical protein